MDTAARAFFDAVENLAAVRLPPTIEDRFYQIHRAIMQQPTPGILERLKPTSESKRDWFQYFRTAVVWHVPHGLNASGYHYSRVAAVETEIVRIGLELVPHMQLRPLSSIGGGNTSMLDFEYQAFAFSLRRTLEYLAVAVGAFFKSDAHSIRDLVRTIAPKRPEDLALKVANAVAAGFANLEDILPNEARASKSVRDRLAHWEAVSAGVVNVIRTTDGYEVTLAGGGHDVSRWKTPGANKVSRDEKTGTGFLLLGSALRDQLERVSKYIFDVYDAFGIPPAGA